MQAGVSHLSLTRPTAGSSARIRTYAAILTALWTLVIVGSAGWALYNNYLSSLEAARIEARSSFNKDLVYRRWVAMHGGVYVPISVDTPPNPYLSVAQRDVTTTDGQQLTLVNPAYMTRQVHELDAVTYGTRGHITSLNPIRPENAADAWETAALLAFEAGEQEVSSVETQGGVEIMRYMHVMRVEESCLSCHADQGYVLGDVRGGISVAVPMQPYWEAAHHGQAGIIFGHGLVWSIGLLAIVFSSSRILQVTRREHDYAEQLRKSARLYHQMFQEHAAVKLVVDPATGGIHDANRAATQFYGYSAAQLRALHISDLRTHPEDDEHALPDPASVASGFYSQRHRLADGRIRDIDVFSSPIDTDEGPLLHLIIVDVSTRRLAENLREQAEEELRRSNAYLESLLESQSAFVLRTDMRGRYTYVNDTMYECFRWMYPSREDMLGTPSMDTILPDDHAKTFEVVRQCSAQPGTIVQVELRKPTEDGGFFWALWDFVALTDAAGKVSEIQCIGIDTTDTRKATEREFELVLEKERHSLLATFIKHASHEFRTPLSAISSSSYLMLRARDEERRQQKAEQIETQVQRITRLVDALLLMATLESGGPDMQRPTDLNALLEGIGTAMARTLETAVSLNWQLTPDLPPVAANPHHLGDALRQIIDNAYRFTPAAGSIRLGSGTDAGQVWVEVADTGPGIDADALPHIFDTFWRQDEAHSTPGFGVGLSIAQKIIHQHGGSIEVTSQPDEGTCVRVSLPVAVPEAG